MKFSSGFDFFTWSNPFTFLVQHEFLRLFQEIGQGSSVHLTVGQTKHGHVANHSSSVLIATASQHLAPPVLWAEGLLINSPLTSTSGTVTSQQDGFIAVPGVTAAASRHESTPVYVRAVSSSSSAGAQSGTDRSTFRERTGVCVSECMDLSGYRE